jgi:FkbM family methyltransferase
MSWLNDWLGRDRKISYAQYGEDLIVGCVLSALKVRKPTYLDIGAHLPTHMNNTYLLYKKGFRGVCVEPDPVLFHKFARKRRMDVCINAGVGLASQVPAEFYVMSVPSLSTFSRGDAEQHQERGVAAIERIEKIPILDVNEIIRAHFSPGPDYVSIDVEGHEMDILRTFDFVSFRPSVFCVETLTFSIDNTERKAVEVNAFMEPLGYFSYADTYINTVFVDKAKWKNR